MYGDNPLHLHQCYSTPPPLPLHHFLRCLSSSPLRSFAAVSAATGIAVPSHSPGLSTTAMQQRPSQPSLSAASSPNTAPPADFFLPPSSLFVLSSQWRECPIFHLSLPLLSLRRLSCPSLRCCRPPWILCCSSSFLPLPLLPLLLPCPPPPFSSTPSPVTSTAAPSSPNRRRDRRWREASIPSNCNSNRPWGQRSTASVEALPQWFAEERRAVEVLTGLIVVAVVPSERGRAKSRQEGGGAELHRTGQRTPSDSLTVAQHQLMGVG